MSDTTVEPSFPDDDLRAVMRLLARRDMLEPHEHAGFTVSGSEVMTLGALSGQVMSQQDLALALGLEKSTVSRLAAGLQARGWLDRERDPANRRFYLVRLTAQGQRAADLIGAELSRHHQQILAALTPAERESLSIGLRALVRVLSQHHHQHLQVLDPAG